MEGLQDMELRRERKAVSYRSELFEIWWHVLVDENGKSHSSPDLDIRNLRQLENQYREQHRIPFPREIAAIRKQYGLSAARLSELLDLGINSVGQYERGKMPSLANARLIRQAADPRWLLALMSEKRALFSLSSYARKVERIKQQMDIDRLKPVVEYLWNFHMNANRYTGFVRPSFEKVAQFVNYFALHARPLKTRLNKLLFYADFFHFKRRGFSISGCNYRAIPFGPVPSHFHELFGLLENQGIIRIEEEHNLFGGAGERFRSETPFDASAFTPAELGSMTAVLKEFRGTTSRSLISMSHEETAWTDNEGKRELIDYQEYAYKLKAM